MLELLQFVFSSFWTWAGSVVLLLALSLAISACVPNIKYTKTSTSKEPTP